MHLIDHVVSAKEHILRTVSTQPQLNIALEHHTQRSSVLYPNIHSSHQHHSSSKFELRAREQVNSHLPRAQPHATNSHPKPYNKRTIATSKSTGLRDLPCCSHPRTNLGASQHNRSHQLQRLQNGGAEAPRYTSAT